jgi:DNA-binding GntR family transcriptional regulator
VRYITAALGERIPPEALRERSAVALVETTLAIRLGSIALSVRASAATKELSRKMQVARGSPLLIREHTFFDAKGRPILCGEAIYRGDKYRIAYTLRGDRSKAGSSPARLMADD